MEMTEPSMSRVGFGLYDNESSQALATLQTTSAREELAGSTPSLSMAEKQPT
jgi:hypothetical protein